MARKARVVAEGVPHHITQRGNNRQDVFLLPEDRRFYLETLREKSKQHGLALLGYCLMTNHVHVVAIPKHSDSLALALGQTHGKYSCWFNRHHPRSGHLWQNRFYSCALGPSHVVTALAYVDLNPVRASLVPKAADYLWSSAQAHLAGAGSDPLLDDWAWSELRISGDWAETLEKQSQLPTADELRRATYAGLPFGDETFVAAMERRCGRALRRHPPGPARKAAAAVAGPDDEMAAICTSRS